MQIDFIYSIMPYRHYRSTNTQFLSRREQSERMPITSQERLTALIVGENTRMLLGLALCTGIDLNARPTLDLNAHATKPYRLRDAYDAE